MYNAKAYSAARAASPLTQTTITRRDLTEHDVQIEILFCGICHSDLHYVGMSGAACLRPTLPSRPRIVAGLSASVPRSRSQAGRLAGVGCLVDSDALAPNARPTLSSSARHDSHYGSPDKHLTALPTAATLTASSLMSTSCCACPPTSILPGPRRCFAPELQPTRRCATGVSAKVKRLGGGLGDWATWA